MSWKAGALHGVPFGVVLAMIASLTPLVGIGGCNPPPATTVTDSGPREDSGPIAQPVVATTAGTVNLGCVGTATVPAPTTMTSGTFHIQEFLSMAPITGDRIDIFTNGVITDGCAAPDCTTYTTSGTGDVALTLGTGAWFAYRLAVSGQTAAVLGYDQPWVSTSGQLPGYGFAPGTITAVGMLFMRDFQADRYGSMSGRVVDCAGQPLANVRMRVFVDGTEVVNGPLADRTSARITGIEAPNPTRSGLTGASGNFAGANIPPSGDCHVEAWATRTEGALPELIGCSEGRVLVGGITISVVSGLRGDYPAGSRCAAAALAARH